MTKMHEEFLAKLNDERKPLIEAMLNSISKVCPKLTETIKWNAPTYCYNAKDRMTLRIHKKDRVGLILHTGAKP